ncbi:GreA/GreB family elongation factor [Flavobacterium sp. MFBS3-15]|uniref:GreA/GreB family elongation factor n=1 Tax=Flavobacterium sp. MFBS3-15 TaxID=2989816 RepID=UPI002235DAF6|nr:GreA/GreB family elongation factor [Flavobacterium sp. MFBS3-15]MCW4468414.1 GreA/GreB family elongation factor [Flavobacterium sp. MFBS3-15]
MNLLKQKVLAYYKQQVDDRIDAFRDMIAALTEDASNDAKGSAGDKHETALSMMHLEQEKLNHKLKEFIDQKAILDKINPELEFPKVALGSLVKANNMHLFVSAALPKITIDGVTVIALSPQSPLGMKMMGMEQGDEFEVGTTNYIIKEIF